jgi:hypothetical protein
MFQNSIKGKKTIFELSTFTIQNPKIENQFKKNILKKNPYQQKSNKMIKFSLFFSKNSKKIRKEGENSIHSVKNVKKILKVNRNFKMSLQSGWVVFSRISKLLYRNRNITSIKKRASINFFNFQSTYQEVIDSKLIFFYFSQFKILKIRKLVKNRKFYLNTTKKNIGRNTIYFKNIKKSRNILIAYIKLKETKFTSNLEKKFILKNFFLQKNSLEYVQLKNLLYNQQKKSKIKFYDSKFNFEKKNIITISRFKLINTTLILKFSKNTSSNNLSIKYKFPQKFIFSKIKTLSEKKIYNTKKNLNVKNNISLENSVFYRYSICSPVIGEVTKIKKDNLGKQKTIFLTNAEKRFFVSENKTIKLFMGKVIRLGDILTDQLASNFTGQIIEQTEKTITIRNASPYLFSIQSLFHIHNSDFVKKNNLLMTLFYQKLKTEDIIQGIPKIEELFEARNSKQSDKKRENIHNKLDLCFYNYKKKYTFEKALKKSIKTIQQILVHSIQKVYQDQGVFIADKHIELIVRQMTTKVFICESDKSGLLQGELIDIKYIESINFGNTFKAIRYKPVILGITKASLETESFISAASFQETTRVLTKAAMEGRIDWLRGLKENIIIGHLIPAGTGSQNYRNGFKKVGNFQQKIKPKIETGTNLLQKT